MLLLPSIDADRDVSTGNTTTAIGADGPINAKYALKGQYKKTAPWIFHRHSISAIRKPRHRTGSTSGSRGSWGQARRAATPP